MFLRRMLGCRANEAEVFFQASKMLLPAQASERAVEVTNFENDGLVVAGSIKVKTGYKLGVRFEVSLLLD